MAQSTTVTKAEVLKLIERCFTSLAFETEAYVPVFDEPGREVHEQRRMVDERLQELRSQIRTGHFETVVESTAVSLLRNQGFDGECLPPGLMRDLVEGVARAMAEQQRLYEFRLGDRLMPYQPSDPLFASTPFMTAIPHEFASSTQTDAVGPTVREAVDRFLIAKRKKWVGKTLENRKRQLGLLVEHLGPERRLHLVKTDDLRAYRDGLLRLRRAHHVGASMTFVGRQTENDAMRIEPKTALIHLQNSRTFLRWAVAEGYLDKDPSAGVGVEMPKSLKTAKTRRPFSKSDLGALFGSPTFVGCKSPRRRSQPGSMVIRDALYWIPLLGYFTGARMGELVQLHVADVHTDEPIPFIDITDAGSGDIGSGSEKHVKSMAGIRRVPIHAHLIELGFLDFIRKRAKDTRASKRLWFEIQFGKDLQASSPFSKRFSRLMDSVGLTDPALVFHSFRHTVEDALRNALQPQYVIDRIVGHADDAISAQYGQGVSLEVAAAAVAAMKLPVDVRAVVLCEGLCPPNTVSGDLDFTAPQHLVD